MSTSDLSFFRTRTKQTGQTDQPQEMLPMPDSVKKQLEQLAAQFNRLKEAIQVIEARLTALESGAQVEQKSKQNGHIRSFESDITTHSRQVKR